jgi:hypothetical protein
MAVTWDNTIKQLFTPQDINHMKEITGNALKLDDHESVKTWAGQIWVQVENDDMPPNPKNAWDQVKKKNFKEWMDNGMP